MRIHIFGKNLFGVVSGVILHRFELDRFGYIGFIRIGLWHRSVTYVFLCRCCYICLLWRFCNTYIRVYIYIGFSIDVSYIGLIVLVLLGRRYYNGYFILVLLYWLEYIGFLYRLYYTSSCVSV